MAVIKKTTKRIEHPTEEGAWVEIRVPVTAGDLAGTRDDRVGLMLDLLAASVRAWSYDEPPSAANIEALDMATFRWLAREVEAASNLRSEPEKKDSSSLSPLTSEPDRDRSLASSAT